MRTFANSELGSASATPHVYAMGEAAYARVRSGSTTALVMSGESGSGKTETTKHLLEYVAWSSSESGGGGGGESGGGGGGGGGGGLASVLASRLLSSSSLLEAFGNCKTVRNSNSSRFGKMMRLFFWPVGTPKAGQVAGGGIMTCMRAVFERGVALLSPSHPHPPITHHPWSLVTCHVWQTCSKSRASRRSRRPSATSMYSTN
jgi:hypothetical protein